MSCTVLMTQRGQSQTPLAQARPQAINGQPFGVLAFELPLPDGWDGSLPRVLVEDNEGRIYYPAVTPRMATRQVPQEPLLPMRIGRPGGVIDRLREAVRQPLSRSQVPVAVQVRALYVGDAPPVVRVTGDLSERVELQLDAQAGPESHRQLLEHWWAGYTQQAAAALAADNAPPRHVYQYLLSMLARRLELPPAVLPAPAASRPAGEKTQLEETFELIAGSQSLRQAIFDQVLTRPPDRSGGELPPPDPPQWSPLVWPAATADVPIEPIATRVPEDCFYLRFGSFANYVWFQELTERFGGELAQAFQLQGFTVGGTARIERMLATRLNTVSKLFGDKIIQDMAFIGSDPYVEQGASFAVLFHAANPAILKASLESERRALANAESDAVLREIRLRDRSVSLLSTPDNRIRSFMVSDDAFILVTTSRSLAGRWLELTEGRPSLADNPAFRWVRSRIPDADDYSVFGCLTPEFFQQLLSPRYQIELRRRLEAEAHLEIAELARLTWQSEQGQPAESLGQLIEAGLLPSWFTDRPDGARPLRHGDRWIDSLRGGRGSFLPIADVELSEVSATESAAYQQVADYYQAWGRMDPLFFGLRRFQTDQPGQEQFSIEAYLSPFEPQKYGWLAEQLADPSPLAIEFPADDVVSVQLRVRGAQPDEAYYLFGGLKDMVLPEPEDIQGLVRTLRVLKAAPAYLGAWPKPDIIERLPLGLGSRLARPDYAGYSRMIGGLWRWQDDQWSLLSFHKSILDRSVPQLRLEESSEIAQVRLSVANPQGTHLAQWINRVWWQQGWQASLSNAQLLDALHQQLRVSPESCLDQANRLLDARLQCPLGGQYVFERFDDRSSAGVWTSSAWSRSTFGRTGRPLPPDDYTAPWLDWFRGAKIHATQQPNSLSVVGMVRIELPELATGAASPDATSTLLPIEGFNVFDLPGKLFGKPPAAPADRPAGSPKRQSF